MKTHADQTQVFRSSTGDVLLINRAANGAFFLGRNNVAEFLKNPSESLVTRLHGFGHDVASLLPTAMRQFNQVQNPAGIGEAMSLEFIVGPGIRVLYCSDGRAIEALGLNQYDLVITPERMRAIRPNYVHIALILDRRPRAPLPVEVAEMASQLREATA